MYSAALTLHAWLRWVALAAGLVAFIRAAAGLSGRKPWRPSDDRAGFWFTMTLDVQMLLGFLLYFFLSPFTSQALHDFGGSMKVTGLRFWAVEHPVGMLLGIILAHVGRVRARRTDSRRRHRVAAIFFGLALVLILASIPWPGTANGRPWVRW